MSDRKTEFLRKLRDLLAEYDATIGVEYEGDTHGIHSERLVVTHRVGDGSFREEEWLRMDYRTEIRAADL